MPIVQVKFTEQQQKKYLSYLLGLYYSQVKRLFYADGHQHEISNLIHLSQGCIPIPTSFALRINFEQKAPFIRSLTVQDILLDIQGLGQPREIARKHE